MKAIKLLSLCFSLCVGTAFAQSSPVPMLENATNQIISALESHKTSLKDNPNIIYQTVETHLVPIVDLQGMSRSVLGRTAWAKASATQKQAFAKAFTRLVIRTYASPLRQYSDETVQFLPVRGDLTARFLRVNSLIVRSHGQNIPLTYSLVDKSGQWKIYDISVEGISLLQSFRSQFAGVLQHSSIDAVISEMQAKKGS